MKKLSALLAAVILLCGLLAMPAAASAAGQSYICDRARLLRSGPFSEIYMECKEVSNSHNCGVYIATVNDPDVHDWNVQEYTEKFYQSWPMGWGEDKNGILLLLSMSERDYDIYVCGPMAKAAFSDYAIEKMEEKILPCFAENDWEGGFRAYVRYADKCLTRNEKGIPIDAPGTTTLSGQLRRWNAIGIGAVAGLVVALIRCSILKARMKSIKTNRDADAYLLPNSLRLVSHQDIYTHSTESRVRISSDSRSGGGGTHVSSSGHSHHSGKF